MTKQRVFKIINCHISLDIFKSCHKEDFIIASYRLPTKISLKLKFAARTPLFSQLISVFFILVILLRRSFSSSIFFQSFFLCFLTLSVSMHPYSSLLQFMHPEAQMKLLKQFTCMITSSNCSEFCVKKGYVFKKNLILKTLVQIKI